MNSTELLFIFIGSFYVTKVFVWNEKRYNGVLIINVEYGDFC